MGLMEGSTPYSKLVQKYNQFHVPAMVIKAENSKLDGVSIEDLSVDLSMDKASAVRFNVAGAYDLEKRQFNSKIKSKLKLGTKLSLLLGYGSSLKEVFFGYISDVGVDFSDDPVMSITAMDVRRLMMDASRKSEIHPATTYSAAFQEVMNHYKAICPKTQIDATDSKYFPDIMQERSDYDFVSQELAAKADREFFVLGNTAYFREPAKVTKEITTLSWGEGLLSFSRNSLYQNLKITVIGYDDEKKKAVKAQVTAKSKDGQKNIGPQQETVISDADAKMIKKAKERAEKEARERQRQAQSGSLTCVGLPELVPGRFIKVKGLDPDLDVKYYIHSVHHQVGSEGFTTTLEIGGWEK